MLTPGVDIFLIKLAITLCSYAPEQHCLRKFNLEVCPSSADVRQAMYQYLLDPPLPAGSLVSVFAAIQS